MKAVLIVHNEAIGRVVGEALDKLGANCFTKFTNVLGRGQLSEPHLNTDVWPGVNCATLAVVEPAKADEILAEVRRLRQELGSEGIKAFSWNIEEIS